MSRDRKVLIFGGLALAAFGMFYGLHYALFVEHQTLDQLGGSLATAFVSAAERKLPESRAALDRYAAIRYDYVRQVDVFGAAFDRVAFSGSIKFWIALALTIGAIVFPLGVILQTVSHGSALASALAILGSGLVIMALAATALGFARQGAPGGA